MAITADDDFNLRVARETKPFIVYLGVSGFHRSIQQSQQSLPTGICQWVPVISARR